MSSAFDQLVASLKKLPGLGYRSAERIALHLLLEKRQELELLQASLERAGTEVRRCSCCGNLTEGELCGICEDERRDGSIICVVEQVPDLMALERSEAFRGRYHVLHGKLMPMKRQGPDQLNLASLGRRIETGEVKELILALSNDIEGEATCHYILDELVKDRPIQVSRIGFGLPSGGGVLYADQVTLKSALDGRRDYR